MTYWSTGCDISSTHVWICVCVVMNLSVKQKLWDEKWQETIFGRLISCVWCLKFVNDVNMMSEVSLGLPEKLRDICYWRSAFFCFLEKSRSKCFCQSDCTKFVELEHAFCPLRNTRVHMCVQTFSSLHLFASFERGETFSSINLFLFGEKSFTKAIIPNLLVFIRTPCGSFGKSSTFLTGGSGSCTRTQVSAWRLQNFDYLDPTT